MMNDENTLIEHSFYLSSMFSTMKPEHSWSTNEIKLILLLFSAISEHRIYIPDLLIENRLEGLKSRLETIPNEYVFTRDNFSQITGIKTDHLSREIKKTIKSLANKYIFTPHPLDADSEYSCVAIPWFSELKYLNSTGEIYFDINKKALERLVAFVKYSKINFKYIARIKNHNSINLYVLFKIMLDTTLKRSLTLDISDLKTKLNLAGKYKDINLFRDKVLKVSSDEINKISDIEVSFSLEKEGRSFKKVIFQFNSKARNSNLDKPEQQPQERKYQEADAPLNLDVNGHDIIIAAQLQSYGIPRNKALEYVKTYGVDICKIGIEKLLGEIQKGRDIKNISGYLVSCIENAGNNSSSQEIKAAMDAADELVQDRKAQEMERFNGFDTYINNNEQQILVLLARNEANEKLTDELEIDMLRCLKDVVSQYDDLESMSPYYLTLRFKGDILSYINIKSLVEELEVASKEERIAKLKAELEAKKTELEEVSVKAKGLVEKEITMLKVAIADLV
jgi:hypothetical protein